MNINNSQRSELLAIYSDAVAAVNGARCAKQYLENNPVTGDICLIAIGKAACSMASGAQSVLGERIRDSLVITKYGCHQPPLPELNVLEAGHPLPDAHSLVAGRQLLDLLRRVSVTTELLFLISGGTSALVEVLPGASSLADLEKLNTWLLKSGLPIGEINAIRKRVSCIKGGRLARYLGGRRTTVLLLSDVRGDDPAVIGSGLLSPHSGYANSVAEQALPDEIRQLLSQAPPMPVTNDPCFANIHWEIIANLQRAIDAAETSALNHGYHAVVHREYLQGDARECGERIAQTVKARPGTLHIWGGEPTVTLPKNPGRGGRCQSLALSAAIALQDTRNWCLLAAGTDGDDGASGAAGACIDAGSILRALEKLGNRGTALDYLNNADAGSFFAASGDLIKKESTGTNVNDLVFGFCKD